MTEEVAPSDINQGDLTQDGINKEEREAKGNLIKEPSSAETGSLNADGEKVIGGSSEAATAGGGEVVTGDDDNKQVSSVSGEITGSDNKGASGDDVNIDGGDTSGDSRGASGDSKDASGDGEGANVDGEDTSGDGRGASGDSKGASGDSKGASGDGQGASGGSKGGSKGASSDGQSASGGEGVSGDREDTTSDTKGTTGDNGDVGGVSGGDVKDGGSEDTKAEQIDNEGQVRDHSEVLDDDNEHNEQETTSIPSQKKEETAEKEGISHEPGLEIETAAEVSNRKDIRETPIEEDVTSDISGSDQTVTIDGIPVLENITEEGKEEEASREEIMLKIKAAMEEKERLLQLNRKVHQKVADYLARKKDDEKADPGRTAIDHEKKYFQTMTTLDSLQEEMEAIKEQYGRRETELRSLRDKKLEEIKDASVKFAKYRKEVVVKAMNNRTGKRITAADVDQFLALEAKKEADIVQLRLEGIKLQNKISKLEAEIKQKEQLAGGLHMIDFEQLKINNVDLNEKIEERNDDILKQKKKVTSTVQVLTHVKEKLQFLQAENAGENDALRELDAQLAKKRDHLTRMKQARDALRSDNLRLKQRGGLVGHTALLRDYEDKQDQGREMQEKLEKLQKRHSELAVMCDGLKRKIEQAKCVDTDLH